MAFKGSAVERWYEVAPLDVEGMREILHPQIEFRVCEGWPNGGVFHGPDAVIGDFFPGASGSWEAIRPEFEEVIEADDTFIVRGRYLGTAAPTSLPFSIQFVHIWRLRDGLLVSLDQIADTGMLDAAVAGRTAGAD
jgi:uncharacterized protein